MQGRATTGLYCVLGYPVAHSLSPAMHNTALRILGQDALYLAFGVPPVSLAAALRGLEALGVRGANLTIPHKEAAIELLDQVTDEARSIGAVNTVRFDASGSFGDNTDGRGFIAGLRSDGFEPSGCTAVVLGAGGSARAVCHSLLAEG